MTSAILTLNMTRATSFGMTNIIDALDKGNVVILHSKYKCAHIFHKCSIQKEGKQNESNGLVSKTVTVLYKNVDKASLLRAGGWVECLESQECYECSCDIDDIIRRIWWNPKSVHFM